MTRLGEIRFLGLLCKAFLLSSFKNFPLLYPQRSHHFISGGFVKVVLVKVGIHGKLRAYDSSLPQYYAVRFDSISKPQNHSNFHSGWQIESNPIQHVESRSSQQTIQSYSSCSLRLFWLSDVREKKVDLVDGSAWWRGSIWQKNCLLE